jgi:hypothetical protein
MKAKVERSNASVLSSSLKVNTCFGQLSECAEICHCRVHHFMSLLGDRLLFSNYIYEVSEDLLAMFSVVHFRMELNPVVRFLHMSCRLYAAAV